MFAAAEDQQRAFMLWEATPAELRFYTISEKGDAFDCGIIRVGGSPESVACVTLLGR